MDRLVIGLVRTSHGVRGNIKVASLSGEADHFLSLKRITLRKNGREREFDVEEIKPMGQLLLMKLRGIDTPEVAKTYAGAEILVPREQAAPLEEGEFYQTDLDGCQIVHEGEVLGVVKSIFQGGPADLLEVKTEGGVFLVPFQDPYIGEVDLEEKTIELKTPWLLQ